VAPNRPVGGIDAPATVGTRKLVMEDSFDGPDIDGSRWKYDVGGHGWGNQELQHYTDRPENSFIRDGNLVIRAQPEDYQGNTYTSARMLSQTAVKEGRMEVRAKVNLPPGGESAQGAWPAIWALPVSNQWPATGEIDLFESKGSNPNFGASAAHFSNGGAHQYAAQGWMDKDSTQFHDYAVEWDANRIIWSLDGQETFSLSRSDFGPGGKYPDAEWPYDKQPFQLIMNVAVGGTYDGNPAGTMGPVELEVEHVRMYE
jgi:beta-glucanase (GH16 family)